MHQLVADAGKLAARDAISVPLQGACERAAAGREKLRPRQWLGARVLLEHVSIAQGAAGVAGEQHRLDRVPVKPKMIVTYCATPEQLLSVGEKAAAFVVRFDRARQRAVNSWPAELHSDLVADRQRVAQQIGRF